MGAEIQASFIIPAYNEELFLPRAIESLKRTIEKSGLTAEIVAVDNNSKDRTGELARECGADKILFEPVNSISRARNAGGRAASGKALFFIDADSSVGEDVVRAAMEGIEAGRLCGGGARLAFDAEMPKLAVASTWLWNRLAPLLGYAAGSFVFCRKDAFDGIGGFDESLYAAEDIDFSKRLKGWGRAKGLRFEILPGCALSSARRIKGRSVWPLFFRMASLLAMPWRLRSKRACSLWYDGAVRD